MTTNRRQVQNSKRPARHDGEPVVTYSRLEAEELASPHDFDAFEPASPLYEAVEVPRMKRTPPRDAFVAEPELRVAHSTDDGVDPFAPEPRSGRFRLLVVFGLGAIALAAGIGVLLATLGPSGPRTATSEPVTPPLLSEPGTEPEDVARTIPTVREIPLVEGANGEAGAIATDPLVPAEAAVAVEPPPPRPRPGNPATETVATEPGQPAVAVPLDAPLATATPQPASAPATESEDDFLRRIEQTLNRIEEPAPAATVVAPAPIVAPAPVVIAPPPADATLQPVFPADTGVELLPGDEFILDEETAVIGDEEVMMDGGGHFDFEQDNSALPDLPAPAATTTTTIAPLPTPPATFDPGAPLPPPPGTFDLGAPLTPPNGLLIEEPPPPAKATRLQRLFPRLLPPAGNAAPAPVN